MPAPLERILLLILPCLPTQSQSPTRATALFPTFSILSSRPTRLISIHTPSPRAGNLHLRSTALLLHQLHRDLLLLIKHKSMNLQPTLRNRLGDCGLQAQPVGFRQHVDLDEVAVAVFDRERGEEALICFAELGEVAGVVLEYQDGKLALRGEVGRTHTTHASHPGAPSPP